jgi:general secretion pathway protein G
MKTQIINRKSRIINRSGFTLIEMVLVLGIVALLVGAGIFQLTGVLEGGREKRVKGDLTTLTSALRAYEMQNGFLPSSEQGVAALVDRPSSRPAPQNWRPMLKKMIVDPWGNPYHYRRPGSKDKGGFDVYSAGEDGQADTADDIGNWQL